MARPRRLYSDGEKFYYIINKKRVFVKVPKGSSMKQVQKVNVKTIINLPETKRLKRRKKKVNPKFQRVPQKNLLDVLTKETQGGLPYFIFKEQKQFPTLDEISKGVKKEEPLKPMKPMKPEPDIFTGMKPEPFTPVKPEPVPKPSKFFNKKIEIVDLSKPKPNPTYVFSLSNPFKRTAKISPEVEVPSLNIKPTTVTNFDPYIQFMKSTNRKNYTSGLLKVFKKNDLPAPSKGDADYKSFKTDLKKALKEYNKKGDDDETDINKDFSNITLGKGIADDGLYNDDIEKILTKRIKDYVPVIPADKTDELLKYVAKGDKRFGAVINTVGSKSDGTGQNGNSVGHWTSVYINNEDDYPSIEYFDPLVLDDIPDRLYNTLKKIARKMNPEMLFKFKPNMIRRQDIKKSTCGYHSMKFLDDRYNSIPFHEASGYDNFIEEHKGSDDSIDGEKDIEEYKKKYSSYI